MFFRSQGIVSAMSILVALGLATQPRSAPAQQCDDLCRHRFEFVTCGVNTCVRYLKPTCLMCGSPLGKAACLPNNDELTGPCQPNYDMENVVFSYSSGKESCECGTTLVNVEGTCEFTSSGSTDYKYTYRCG